ncbi:MAG: IscS subfamily cysteine desulfurase [bacterium]|nr:IscS subfamily cysteine desulfurase [bacterium]
MKLPIYMDSHATTPCDPRVVEAMLPTFTQHFGNAASRNHSYGWEAEALVEKGREQIAALVNCSPKEIVFTSGATESDNLAIKGIAHMFADKGRHIITSVIEHKAVLDSCKRLEKEGFRVTWLPVGKDGLVKTSDVENAIEDDTILVTIMLANNEIGTLNPVGEIGHLCKAKGIFFHCDAVQGLAYEPVDVQEMGIDLLSISAHKMYGPKGIGALYVRRRNPRVRLDPIIDGGGHERGMRSGTLNVPGIVGLGKAAEIVLAERESDAARLRALRDHLRQRLTTELTDVTVNGSLEHRLPNNLNVSFAYVEGESMLMGIKDVAVSSGSACTSASLEPSYVLKALGVHDELAHSSIRFGLHRFTTREEVDYVADLMVRTVRRLREMSPLKEMADEGIDLKKVEWSKH